MKKGFLLTSVLAMALGVGVAVGAHQEAQKVRAEGEVTVYCKVTQSWWKNEGAAVGCYYWKEADENDNNTYPGVRMTAVATDVDVWKATIPAGYDKLIFTRVNGAGDIADWGAKTGNLDVPTDEKILYTITSESEVWGDPGVTGAWSAYEEPAPDVPAEDGYYLVGSKTSFRYEGAVKMLSGAEVLAGNDAEYYGYSGKENETIKVRQYVESEGKDDWSFFVANEHSTEIGAADENSNFKFSKDAVIDIFAKWQEVSQDHWQINFFISAHAERYTVSIYDVYFEGARKASTAEVARTAMATEGVDFEYELPAVNGYYARALYTDADCTVAYEPAKLTENTTLYAKYTRLGIYVTGDATYAGSAGLAWNVDGATYLSSQVQDENNLFEGSVTIPNSASAENKVKVKPLQYVGDDGTELHGQWAGVEYQLGAEYTFVELDGDSNLCFSKGGTFAVYVNKQFKAFINEGAEAFYTKFLSEVGGTCNAQGNTNLTRLKEVWAEQEVTYNSLSSDEKATIVAKGFNGGDESGNNLEKVIAKYHYIVTKYGTAEFKDFIWNQQNIAPQGGLNVTINNSPVTAPVVILIAFMTITSIGVGLYLFNRKKEK